MRQPQSRDPEDVGRSNKRRPHGGALLADDCVIVATAVVGTVTTASGGIRLEPVALAWPCRPVMPIPMLVARQAGSAP